MSHMTYIYIAPAQAHSFKDDIFGECSVILFFYPHFIDLSLILCIVYIILFSGKKNILVLLYT